MVSNVEFITTPEGGEAQRDHRVAVSIDVEDVEPEEDLDASVEILLWKGTSAGSVSTDAIERKVTQVTENDTVNAAFSVRYGTPGTYQLTVEVNISYYGAPGYIIEVTEQEIEVTSDPFTIVEFQEAGEVVELDTPTQAAAPSTYKDAYSDRVSVSFTNITSDGSGTVPSSIDFTPRDNPDISVDTSGRFVTHNIIGGDVVRQKIGKDTVEITVKGVCDEATAQDIDKLRSAKQGTFISDRWDGRVQFASSGTQPYQSGGSVDLDRGEHLYNYTLNLVGVE